MKNKNIKIILIVVLSLLCVSCQQKNTQEQTLTVDDFSIIIDDLDLLIKDELKGIIYFGRDTCPNCLAFNVILNNIVENTDDLIIHKFDTDKWRNHENFQEILNKYNVSNIPSLISINDDGTYAMFEFKKDMESELNAFISSYYINKNKKEK
ncbi:hypothetical protein GMB51_15670 [Turicibacter sanguinis]|jgi:thiol-disulfide isomerase/thioredoxin|uniref:thioredoxin family protein n=1 Tax=Parasutterella excrementihominis TaxID=487175 RepID=UPI0012B0BDBF|nr:thioredoxin family protein [Parasutterella excrementihominis]MSF34352.1 hypothetical protein [Escherichia coli]MTN46524.1 hypothetical protein [Turicibacter sanguinis]MSF58411.1 hypothetical protein [Escherichia coli]MTN52256.1 hypothetical protein [Turicibacter sanguinis]MTN55388.1 hypothetical protein [Turicibacter sanguinis]